MKDRLPDLSRARVLISNDDGINAPGLKLLERIIRPLVRELWVVAPETEQSGAGHSLTLRRPLRLRRVSGRRFAVDGTPTDCVLLGLKKVLKDRPPDLVLSGINRGGNMGEDVTYSGTIAAAMEATLLGFPAIAFSLVTDDRRVGKWATAEHWIGPVLEKLGANSWPPNVFISVNFPDVPARSVKGIEVTRQTPAQDLRQPDGGGRPARRHLLLDRLPAHRRFLPPGHGPARDQTRRHLHHAAEPRSDPQGHRPGLAQGP